MDCDFPSWCWWGWYWPVVLEIAALVFFVIGIVVAGVTEDKEKP